MADRAGYTLVVYALDVSPSMGELKADPGGGRERTRLDWAKELVARLCEPKISSGRKTEAVGVLSFGGKTNNQAHNAYIDANPEDDNPPYAAISCDVAIQTAKPKTVEVVMNLALGSTEGNPVSALMVALDMIHVHKHSKSWSLEIVLITDGESAFVQDEYEDAMNRLDDEGVKLTVLGIDFQDPSEPVDKSKSRAKRLSEKFWRTFVAKLHESMSKTTDAPEFLPALATFDSRLLAARQPRTAIVNGTVSPTHLYIGSSQINPDEAIAIPVRYSKATMKARPPSLSKAWKPAMDLQTGAKSQLLSNLMEQSQSRAPGAQPDPSELAAMISAEVKHYSAYVVKREAPPDATQATTQATQQGASQIATQQESEQQEEEEEEAVAKDDIVKAWKFGSTWVPMEADTFEPLHTQKGVEVIGFFPRKNLRRHTLIGEVRFVWPDLTSPRGQIQFSSLVTAMVLRDMVAVVRWVNKDDSEPAIGVCVPAQEFDDGKQLDYMFWVKLPFAEDEHNFWFPSLDKYKTVSGKTVTEHPMIPTAEQCELMDELVAGLDLDEAGDIVSDDERDMDDEDDKGDEREKKPRRRPWFDPSQSYNPVIHRIKEAIFHASLVPDLDSNPLPPPHPDITKYFSTPAEVASRVEDVTKSLQQSLGVKKVPVRTRKRIAKEGLREDEGYLDIDELFEDAAADMSQKPNAAASGSGSGTRTRIEDPDWVQGQTAEPKPKPGRLISNERPLQDFHRLVEGEGDVFRKAIQDMGAVVVENVAASFASAAFAKAVECLRAMRRTALMYEEAETYNKFVDDLEKQVKAPGFKHPNFWQYFEKAGKDVARISPEEAQEALEALEEGYD
ncbi:ATP-dependent DNA helicase yku80 [Cryptotrichosporon argae]